MKKNRLYGQLLPVTREKDRENVSERVRKRNVM